jgi:hypothetical protein
MSSNSESNKLWEACNNGCVVFKNRVEEIQRRETLGVTCGVEQHMQIIYANLESEARSRRRDGHQMSKKEIDQFIKESLEAKALEILSARVFKDSLKSELERGSK